MLLPLVGPGAQPQRERVRFRTVFCSEVSSVEPVWSMYSGFADVGRSHRLRLDSRRRLKCPNCAHRRTSRPRGGPGAAPGPGGASCATSGAGSHFPVGLCSACRNKILWQNRHNPQNPRQLAGGFSRPQIRHFSRRRLRRTPRHPVAGRRQRGESVGRPPFACRPARNAAIRPSVRDSGMRTG
jgi:hypothetical protein